MSWLYTILFAGLIASSSGNGTQPTKANVTELPIVAVQSQESVERFDQTYPLTASGRLKLSNINGSVTLEAWDRNELKVQYVKTAETDEMLQSMRVQITPRADYVSIETECDQWRVDSTPGRWQNNCGRANVEFHLMVPRGAALNEVATVNGAVTASNFTNLIKLSAVNGNVKAINIRGTASLSSVNGEVSADLDRLDLGSKLSLDSVSGRASIALPSDANATIKADSLSGTITNDLGLPVRRGKYVGQDLYGRIGNGDVQIKLSTVNGALAITRKRDGKTASPIVNLISDDDESAGNWNEVLTNDQTAKTQEANTAAREANKQAREADKASRAARKPPSSNVIVDPKVSVEAPQIDTRVTQSIEALAAALAKSIEILESAKFERTIREQMRQRQELMPRLVEANFNTTMPRIEKRDGGFTIRGVPTVTVEAPDCGVRIQGWDKPEVRYRVVRFSDARSRGSIKVSEDHSDNSVDLRVGGLEGSRFRPFMNDLTQTRLEVYVPKKADLDINAGGEIRVDGVSGNVELTGSDDPINVRDVSGKLHVTNSEGHVRVIGFHGDIVAETSDGMIDLEGDFGDLKASSESGSVILTLPESTSADLFAGGSKVKADGIDITKVSGDEDRTQYRLGKGGNRFEVSTDGDIEVRSLGSLKQRS